MSGGSQIKFLKIHWPGDIFAVKFNGAATFALLQLVNSTLLFILTECPFKSLINFMDYSYGFFDLVLPLRR
ncbi:hypothetical protein ACSBR1_021238 [Camellia fascicularis]